MEKEFIPYEQALELKELGFNENCFRSYLYQYEEWIISDLTHDGHCPLMAPLYQQAFRWFRKKYNLSSQIHPLTSSGQFIWHYLVRDISEYLTEFDLEKFTFNTYEEAELACLKKLIEIVKNK